MIPRTNEQPATIEGYLLGKVQEVKLWQTLEELDHKYRHSARSMANVELDLYGVVLSELQRRGASVKNHEHLYHLYCGVKKCERL